MLTRGTPLRDPSGTIIKWIGTCTDIDNVKQELEKVESSDARYRRILATTTEGVWTINALGQTDYVNERLSKMLGFTSEEMLGHSIFHYINKNNHIDAEAYLKNLRSGFSAQFEFCLRRKDGSDLWVLMSTNPIKNEKSDYVGALIMISDLTERRSLEEQFRQSQKMEAVGRLAGGIAHDFNNLLAIILLTVDTANSGDEAIAAIAAIKKAGNRAAELTKQLLVFSRKQVPEMQILNLNIIVSDSEKLLKRLIGENIRIQTQLSDDLAFVNADRGQIEQVIMNLAVNARDAMPSGGTLSFTTENIVLSSESSQKYQKLLGNKQYALLSVKDTGFGMDDKTKSKIFDPFFTTKEVGKGTGLGLAIVYGVVKQFGGEITVQSEPGKGTTFQIFLPTTQGVSVKVTEETGVKFIDMSGKSVLVVEDEEDLRSITSEILRKNGFTVYEAANGKEALAFFEKRPEKIDLIVSDIVMPDLGGPEFVALLSKNFTNEELPKVLFQSGYSAEDFNKKWGLDKSPNIITKPYTANALLSKIQEIL